jgi:hypothetical protein
MAHQGQVQVNVQVQPQQPVTQKITVEIEMLNVKKALLKVSFAGPQDSD